MSNSLDPDQAQHFVRPDLGQNCLESLTALTTIVGKEFGVGVLESHLSNAAKDWLVSFNLTLFWFKTSTTGTNKQAVSGSRV